MSKQTTENTAFHAMDAAEALRILKSDPGKAGCARRTPKRACRNTARTP